MIVALPGLFSYLFYSTRRFVLLLTLFHFVFVFFSPFSIAITSLGEERANLSTFCTFVRFVLVWICRFRLPLGVWEGLRFVIVALPGLFSYPFFLLLTVPGRFFCFSSFYCVSAFLYFVLLFVFLLSFFWCLGRDVLS